MIDRPYFESNKFATFLYLLMRDKLPTGEVELLIKHVEEFAWASPKFTAEYLESYAMSLAERLR